MAWIPDELDAPLCVRRMLEHINVLVVEFPPSDGGLPPVIQAAVDDLLNDKTGKYVDKFPLRCIRIFRAYGDAGRAVNAAASNRNGPWNDCKDELEHAQNGN
jgi:hypothetical protein